MVICFSAVVAYGTRVNYRGCVVEELMAKQLFVGRGGGNCLVMVVMDSDACIFVSDWRWNKL